MKHSYQLLQLLLVLAVSLGVCVHASPAKDRGQSERVEKYCGSKLSQTMAMLCYNLEKPTDGARFLYTRVERSADGTKRIRRGIADECCKQSCSKETLRSYCP